MAITYKIDNVDLAILECLQVDARMSSTKISQRLGFITSRAIRNRLNKLISEGIIVMSVKLNPEIHVENKDFTYMTHKK